MIFNRNKFTLEFTHVQDRNNIYKFTVQSNTVDGLFSNHIDLVRQWVKQTQKLKSTLSDTQKEELK